MTVAVCPLLKASDVFFSDDCCCVSIAEGSSLCVTASDVFVLMTVAVSIAEGSSLCVTASDVFLLMTVAVSIAEGSSLCVTASDVFVLMTVAVCLLLKAVHYVLLHLMYLF